MSYPVLPFELLQGDWEDRWQFFDRFWSLWSGVEVDSTRGLDRIDAAYPLAAGLPPSARRLVALESAGDSLGGMLRFRDPVVVRDLAPCPATTLLQTPYEGIFWAVASTSRELPDPPVAAFGREDASSQVDVRLDWMERAQSVTSFAFQRHLGMCKSRGGDLSTRRAHPHDDSALTADLGPAIHFDELELHYREGVLTVVSRDVDAVFGCTVRMFFFDEAAANSDAPVVTTAIARAGGLSGAAATRRFRGR